MDSDAINTLTADLAAALKAALPADWSIWDAEGPAGHALGVVLYYEQGDLVTTINGGPVPPGCVGVEYTLTLTAPETDPEKGTATATAAAMDLLPALDGLSDLYWDRAQKMRLPTGETAYRLAVVYLSTYRATPTPEPDPEPDPMPEEA